MNNRKYKIVELINQLGYIRFSDLCNEFNVSPATMRRDLVALADEGLIQRVHGGAKSIHPTIDRPNILSAYERSILSPQEKITIAQCAFQTVHDHTSIILDDSTTCTELAKLISRSDLTLSIITNNFDIVALFKDHPTIDLFFIGGIVHKSTFATCGSIAEQITHTLNCDLLFMGTDAVDPQKGFMNNRLDIIPLKQAMMRAAAKTIVLADHTKFNKKAMMQITPFDNIDYVITDPQLSSSVYDSFGDQKSKIIRATIDEL